MRDFFADQVSVSVMDALDCRTVGLFFGLRMDGRGFKERILLSQEDAKKLALILVKALKQKETTTGYTIALDEEFYKRVGIAPEDF